MGGSEKRGGGGDRENSHSGGLLRALATSFMLGRTVLMPFPFPSTFAMSFGILYL